MPETPHIWEVELPNKHVLEIQLPADTPIEQVRERARILLNQRQNYPTAAELGGRPQDVAPNPILSQLKQYLPSAQTAARVGGSMVGGLIGGAALRSPAGIAFGGGLGGSTGESFYQLGKRYIAPSLSGEALPQTGGEAALRQAESLTQGALQEGLPAYLTTKFPAVLQRGAEKRIGETIVPGGSFGERRELAKVIRPVEGEPLPSEAVKDFPISATRAELLNKIVPKAEAATRAVDDAYKSATNAGKTFQGKPIADALEKIRNQSMRGGASIAGKQGKVAAYNEIIDWLRNQPDFTADEFRLLKSEWDDTINHYAGGLGPDPEYKAAFEDAANFVREAIHQSFPDIAKADRTAHMWITARDALKRVNYKDLGKEAMYSFSARALPSAGLGAGVALMEHKSPYEGALIGGAIGALTKTPLWKTLSVAERAMLIRGLQSRYAPAILGATSDVASGGIEEAMRR